MMKFDAVLFDLDGTIMDSAPGIFATLLKTFEHYGVKREVAELSKYLGPPLRFTMADNVPQSEVENATALYRKIYEKDGIFNAVPYEGVADMLAALKNAGLTLCVATCKPKTVAEAVLEHFGLISFFDYVGGASLDTSVDTKTAVIESVLVQQCMTGKTAIMVGDRADDMIGAKNCNLPAIGALYGYGSKEELAPFEPVFMAKSPIEISDYLKEEN